MAQRGAVEPLEDGKNEEEEEQQGTDEDKELQRKDEEQGMMDQGHERQYTQLAESLELSNEWREGTVEVLEHMWEDPAHIREKQRRSEYREMEERRRQQRRLWAKKAKSSIGRKGNNAGRKRR